MSTSLIQNTFGGGELSPSLAKRADLSRYRASVAVLRNMTIHKHAAVSNRGGFRYVGETKETDVRLVPFIYSDDQSYVLEFGNNYMRVMTDGAYVINSPGRGTSIKEAITYEWYASAAGSNEYYLVLLGGTDPSISDPEAVYEDVGGADTVLTEGTMGALAIGEWAYGDNDALGFQTIYVRLTDETDPDVKVDGYLEAAYIYEITDGEASVDAPGEATNLARYGSLKWTASGTGSEYYLTTLAGTDPGFFLPTYVYERSAGGSLTVAPREGVLGTLQPGEFGFGDNDGLGFSAIYLRLASDTDPQNELDGSIEAAYSKNIDLFGSALLRELDYTQSYDVMYMTGDPDNIHKLTRVDHDLWVCNVQYMDGTKYPDLIKTAAAITGSSRVYAVAGVDYGGREAPIVSVGPAPGAVAVTPSIAAGTTSGFSWQKQPQFKYYRVYKLSPGLTGAGFGLIDEVRESNYKDTADAAPDLSQYPKTKYNPFGSNGANEVNGAPLKCTMIGQRLVLANSNLYGTQNIWGSVIGDFENFSVGNPIKEDDGYEFIMDSIALNPIRWTLGMNDLLIGTAEGEYRATGSNGGYITPLSISIRKQSSYGCSGKVKPVQITNRAIFLTKTKNNIRDMSYSFETDSYVGNDLTIFARHLFENKEIRAWAYQKDPDSILWVVKEDGSMAGLSLYQEQEINGWHRHDTPNGLFKDVVSIPNAQGEDEIYVHVHRKVGGVTKSFIERLHTRLPASDDDTYDVKDAFMVDSGLTYDNPISIEGITKANPGVLTITGHGLVDGDIVDIAQVVGMTELNGNRYKVLKLTADTFTLTTMGGTDIDTTSFTTYESGGYVREAVTTLSGLDHLEGETVDVLQDGFVTQKVVTSGAITLSVPASRVHAGLSYGWELKSLSFAPMLEDAVVLDKPRDVPEVFIELENSRGVSVRGRNGETYEIEFRTDEELGDPTRLFTGYKIESVSAGEDAFDGYLSLHSDKPLPVTINAIIPKVNYGNM